MLQALLAMLHAKGRSTSPDANPVILSADEFSLWSMSYREDSEHGIDAYNADTFGDDADQPWSYEQ